MAGKPSRKQSPRPVQYMRTTAPPGGGVILRLIAAPSFAGVGAPEAVAPVLAFGGGGRRTCLPAGGAIGELLGLAPVQHGEGLRFLQPPDAAEGGEAEGGKSTRLN